jgi:hypothetical protein
MFCTQYTQVRLFAVFLLSDGLLFGVQFSPGPRARELSGHAMALAFSQRMDYHDINTSKSSGLLFGVPSL